MPVPIGSAVKPRPMVPETGPAAVVVSGMKSPEVSEIEGSGGILTGPPSENNAGAPAVPIDLAALAG
ncbi:hypothetical protein [Jannaschia seohaensis]|uniref:hypothetical protein n=1 Tax=Jannaschia seohaensis TaxID=475081 RepID=UPI000D6CA986|nr:hypothetical protein [Jannaschia seohaensis]